MQRAGAYLRNGKVYIFSENKAIGGALIGQDDIAVLDAADHKGIAAAALTALMDSREGVPMPDPPINIDGWKMYARAGVRNWQEFVTGTKSVSIRSERGTITVLPERNRGARDGFVSIADCARSVAESSPDIGATILNAFEDAK